MQIKSKKWLDGKNWDMWPNIAEHIGWVVVTAGPIDLEVEGSTPMYNSYITELPPEFPMILKAIDKDGMAYGYHHDSGVLRMPATLLKPWQR